MFDYKAFNLPIVDIIPEVKTKLEESQNLIVHAAPGAGKSTLLPLVLLNEFWLKGKKILMLEPRRLAVKSIAARMSQILQEEVGNTIGYSIRFESKLSEHSRIEVVTEGILTKMLQADNSLEDVGLVIFDEFHERSVHADLAMALVRDTQKILREDLKLMVMSATIDSTHLSNLLKAEVVFSKGRQFPVDVIYTKEGDLRSLPETTARTIISAIKKNSGDILVFLPGQGEIRKCEGFLSDMPKNVVVYPLYGQLPLKDQVKAIIPDKKGRRKIVLATSIAETSLTIEGIKIVVDSGFSRSQRFDPNSGLSRLDTIRVSKDSADQRAGRAGRLCEGVCYRMWSLATQNKLNEHTIPEIEEVDLANLKLETVYWGITDVFQMSWLTLPPKGHIEQASSVLHNLGALQNDKLTSYGRKIYKVPTHPRLAHMLLVSEEQGMLGLAIDVAAVLEEGDLLGKEVGVDINLRLEALRKFRQGDGCKNFIQIDRVAAQYRQLFSTYPDNGLFDEYDTGFLLAQAFPERISHALPGKNAHYQLSNGKIARVPFKDDLAYEPWLVIANLNSSSGVGTIFLASSVDPKSLETLVKEKKVISWDSKSIGLITLLELRLGTIVYKSNPFYEVDNAAILKVLCETIKKEGERLLVFDKKFEQLYNRISTLRIWNKGQNWPDFSISVLLDTCEKWLSPYLLNVRTNDQLKKLSVTQILYDRLSFDQQKLLSKLAPIKILVPSGSSVPLTYLPEGRSPILAVRLQECFGLIETPSVNDGKVCVLLHLLSPGFKPVQVTSDLVSFWNTAYYEVKKEMKRKYPKHYWPDDPFQAKPVKGVKRKFLK